MSLPRKKDEKGKFITKTLEDFKGLVQVGQKFGDWQVVSSEVRLHGKARRLQVLVNDGIVEKYVDYSNLKDGKSTASLKAKKYKIEEYDKLRGRWEQMMDRCYNPSAKHYSSYGGRGVKVSEEFKDCPTYCRYISELPNKSKERYHIDRIDNDGDYERGNLRWVTPAENQLNKRTTIQVTYEQITMPFSHFVRNYCSISPNFARKLHKQGKSIEEIANTVRKCVRPDKRRGN